MGIRSILHELCLWGSCRLLEEVQRCPYAIEVSNRKLQLSYPLAKCKLSLSTREPCGETVPGFIQRLDKEPRYNDFQKNGSNASSHLSYQTLGCDLFYCLPFVVTWVAQPIHVRPFCIRCAYKPRDEEQYECVQGTWTLFLKLWERISPRHNELDMTHCKHYGLTLLLYCVQKSADFARCGIVMGNQSVRAQRHFLPFVHTVGRCQD